MTSDLSGPSPAGQVQVCRADEARTLMAGDEMASMYFWTDRLVFSVSQIPPGARSSRDPGHQGADEVCYVFSGALVIEFPRLQRWERLGAGDEAAGARVERGGRSHRGPGPRGASRTCVDKSARLRTMPVDLGLAGFG